MTTQELKETIDRMSEEERLFAAAYIKAQSMAADPAWIEELERRKQAMERGEGLSSESVRELHKGLKDRGL